MTAEKEKWKKCKEYIIIFESEGMIHLEKNIYSLHTGLELFDGVLNYSNHIIYRDFRPQTKAVF